MDRVCVCVSGFSPKGQVGLMNTRGAWNLVCINAEAGLPTLPLNARVVKIAGGAYHLRNCCLYHSRKANLELFGMWTSVMQVLCTQLTRDETVRHGTITCLCGRRSLTQGFLPTNGF